MRSHRRGLRATLLPSMPQDLPTPALSTIPLVQLLARALVESDVVLLVFCSVRALTDLTVAPDVCLELCLPFWKCPALGKPPKHVQARRLAPPSGLNKVAPPPTQPSAPHVELNNNRMVSKDGAPWSLAHEDDAPGKHAEAEHASDTGKTDATDQPTRRCMSPATHHYHHHNCAFTPPVVKSSCCALPVLFRWCSWRCHPFVRLSCLFSPEWVALMWTDRPRCKNLTLGKFTEEERSSDIASFQFNWFSRGFLSIGGDLATIVLCFGIAKTLLIWRDTLMLKSEIK